MPQTGLGALVAGPHQPQVLAHRARLEMQTLRSQGRRQRPGTPHLRADRLVELQVVDSIGRETVRVTLTKTGGSLGKSVAGA